MCKKTKLFNIHFTDEEVNGLGGIQSKKCCPIGSDWGQDKLYFHLPY